MSDKRSIAAGMDTAAVAAVDARLDAIITEHGVHMPFAIESGSRAWGFPSPDSDYDARFLFVRPAAQLLTLWPLRDVIETPIAGELDVNGWELGKALRLLLKGNAVVIEWLQSPIVYRADPAFRAAMLSFAERWADRERIANHYLRLGRRQRDRGIGAGEAGPLKRTFYALRPAAALRWLRLNPERAVAPMHFPTLMTQADVPAEVAALTAALIARKAVTRELGVGLIPAPVLAFIDAELAMAEAVEPERGPVAPEARAEAEALFRAETLRLDAAAGG